MSYNFLAMTNLKIKKWNEKSSVELLYELHRIFSPMKLRACDVVSLLHLGSSFSLLDGMGEGDGWRCLPRNFHAEFVRFHWSGYG